MVAATPALRSPAEVFPLPHGRCARGQSGGRGRVSVPHRLSAAAAAAMRASALQSAAAQLLGAATAASRHVAGWHALARGGEGRAPHGRCAAKWGGRSTMACFQIVVFAAAAF